MGKFPKELRSQRKKHFPWLIVKDGIISCMHCPGTSFVRKITCFQQHQDSKKHRSAIMSSSSNSISKFVHKTSDWKNKADEIRFAAGLVMHSSLRSADCFSRLIGVITNNECELKLKRTKAHHIVKNVLGRAMKEELVEDLSGVYFSLMVDESTDLSVTKTLAITVRYFSCKFSKIVDQLLALVRVASCRGEDLFNALMTVTEDFGLNMKMCIGLATDGASNLVGEKNSLWSRFCQIAPNAVLMPCICHSLNLVVSQALVGSIDPMKYKPLIQQVPRFFSRSDKRQTRFKEFCEKIDPHKSSFGHQAAFRKFNETRFLSSGPVLSGILENFDRLKAFFYEVGIKEKSWEDEAYCEARFLYEIMQKPSTYLYLCFLSPIIDVFEKINRCFQQTKHVNIPETFWKLEKMYIDLKSRIRKNNLILSYSSTEVDYGLLFHKACISALEKAKNDGNHEVIRQEILHVKRSCFNFLELALSELEKRIPKNFKIFKNMAKIDPEVMTQRETQPALSTFPFINIIEDSQSGCIEEEYKNLKWLREDGHSVFSNVDHPEKFFSQLFFLKDEDDNLRFRNISRYMLGLLSLPLTNSYVESIFSIIAFCKNKWKNQTRLPLLESILRIKANFNASEKCCHDFPVTDRMVKLHTSAMYDFKCNLSQPTSNSDLQVSSQEGSSSTPAMDSNVNCNVAEPSDNVAVPNNRAESPDTDEELQENYELGDEQSEELYEEIIHTVINL